MKFNLAVTIPEVVEECTHGSISYEEVKLVCRRSVDEVIISQGSDVVQMNEDQAKELYYQLSMVFGE